MKANSRRRVLISSMAMLLVAIVALGTATYAWFTSSTTATANGINVQTIKSSELQISSINDDWGTKVNYNVSKKTLLPASTANGSTWFAANAALKGSFAADTVTPAAISGTAAGSYYFVDQLNVRNNGSADVKDVKITFSVPNDYLRIALVPAVGKGANQATAYEEGQSFVNCVYDNAGTAYGAAASVKEETVQDEAGKDVTVKSFVTTTITPDNSGTVNIGVLEGKGEGETTGEAVYYNLYVWFEGQDVDCIDTNAGAVISDIEFTISGTTVEE